MLLIGWSLAASLIEILNDSRLESKARISSSSHVMRCGNKDQKVHRRKRWTTLGTAVWPQKFMPLTIGVAGGIGHFGASDIRATALQCALVGG